MRFPHLRRIAPVLAMAAAVLLWPAALLGAEDQLILPDLHTPTSFGIDGHLLLTIGIAIAVLGILFGLVIYGQLKRLPVHRAMLEVSDLIYETCKTYLLNQGKFILILWVCIAAVMVAYFGFLRGGPAEAAQVVSPADADLHQYG